MVCLVLGYQDFRGVIKLGFCFDPSNLTEALASQLRAHICPLQIIYRAENWRWWQLKQVHCNASNPMCLSIRTMTQLTCLIKRSIVGVSQQNLDHLGCVFYAFILFMVASLQLARAQTDFKAGKLFVSAYSSCAALTDHRTLCWGNIFQRLTNQKQNPGPGLINELNGASYIYPGSRHVCALTATKNVQCWGNNDFGQLGNGTYASSNTPVDVLGLTQAKQLAASDTFACAILQNDTVKCWGDNTYGQLASESQKNSNVPVTIPGIENAASISVSLGHACVLRTNGTVLCWGINSSGQIGNGSPLERQVIPALVYGITNATKIATGRRNTCAIVGSGEIYCWGSNYHNLVGPYQEQTIYAPQKISGISDAIAVSLSTTIGCALESTGISKCWGNLAIRGLNGGIASNYSQPVIVRLGKQISDIVVADTHICVLFNSSSVQCWGDDRDGQLGTHSTSTALRRPKGNNQYELNFVNAIAVGYEHMCAIDLSGNVICWGSNNAGQIGNPSANFNRSIWRVPGLSGVIALAAGSGHTCSVQSNQQVACWGNNFFGQSGGTALGYATPNHIANLHRVVSLAAGLGHSCALTSEGAIFCWGANQSGQIGNGKFENTANPEKVLVDAAVAIGTGATHTCAVLFNGRVACWGYNSHGQIGDGTQVTRANPTLVPAVEDAIAVAAGEIHSCALLRSGLVKCWGGNIYGQLGTLPSNGSSYAVYVGGIHTATALVSGSFHNCVAIADGSLRCWGKNDFGQIGDNSVKPISGLSTPWYEFRATSITAGYNRTCSSNYCWGQMESNSIFFEPNIYTAYFNKDGYLDAIGPRSFDQVVGLESVSANYQYDGTAPSFTLYTGLRARLSDVGLIRKVFIFVADIYTPHQAILAKNSSGSWVPIAENHDWPYIEERVLPISAFYTVLSKTNITNLCDKAVFVGYGIDAQDMLNNKRFAPIFYGPYLQSCPLT